MTEYLLYTKLDEWQQNDVVVVHILDDEHARVRTHYPNRQSALQPIECAFDEAHRIARQDLHIKRIGVYLDEEAPWNPSWGTLIPTDSNS